MISAFYFFTKYSVEGLKYMVTPYLSPLSDDDGDYVENSDVETTYFDIDNETPLQHYCKEHERFHNLCPMQCSEPHKDTHEYCVEVKKRLDKYSKPSKRVLTKDETIDWEFYTNARWIKQFANQWGFWLYDHPNSVRGDSRPSRNQSLNLGVKNRKFIDAH